MVLSTLVVAAGKGADSIALGANAGTVNGGGLADTITLVAGYAGGIVSGDGQGTTTAGTGTGGAADGADKISFTAAKIAGATSVYGGGGNDTILFAASASTSNINVYAGDGADLIGGSAQMFTLVLSSSMVALALTPSSFKLSPGLPPLMVVLVLTASTSAGSANGASILGGAGADTITFAGSEVMGALSAATMVTIDGGAGSDSIFIGSMTKGGTSAQTTVALSSTLVNVVVGSGDSIQVLEWILSAPSRTGWLIHRS